MTQKFSDLEKKPTDHKHDKYITTLEFNKLTANLITKTDFDAKLSDLNKKIVPNKTEHLIINNELKKLKKFDLGYFIGKSHFDEDDAQNYLIFQPIL